MSLLLSDIQGIFKNLGKLIFIAEAAPTHSDVYREVMMTTVREAITGVSSEYTTFSGVLVPLSNNISALCTNLDRIPGFVQQTAETYLTQIVAPQLGLTGTPSPTIDDTNAALIAQMSAVGAYVPPSGTNGSNADGYAMYFFNTWGAVLPQNASSTISDGWIGITVV